MQNQSQRRRTRVSVPPRPAGLRMTVCAEPYRDRRLRLEVFRSVSAGSPLCLRLLPVPCGKPPKVASLLQTTSGISPGALRLSPAPAQSSPGAEGTLQIWPTDDSCDYFSITLWFAAKSPELRARPPPPSISPTVR